MPSASETETGSIRDGGDMPQGKSASNNDGSESTEILKGSKSVGGDNTKRKSDEVTATPDRPLNTGLRPRRNVSDCTRRSNTKKKRGGIADLFEKMHDQKEELNNNPRTVKGAVPSNSSPLPNKELNEEETDSPPQF